jgi:ribosome recycling factor
MPDKPPIDFSPIVERFAESLRRLRVERATPALVEEIEVVVYGSKMPLKQLATITTPHPRTLEITVWDKQNVSAVEEALRAADLGAEPQTSGQQIRIHLPPLTQERREELVAVLGRLAEEARVAVRQLRERERKRLKEEEKAEDERKRALQKLDEEAQRADEEIQQLRAQKEEALRAL